MIRVLFVCAGNICRSPMAEAVFQEQVNKAGLSDKVSVDSAGTGSWHVGERAHRGTLNELKRHGITEYNGRSRQFRPSDMDDFDYVLVMDESNLRSIQRYGDHADAELRHFLDYAKDAGTVSDNQVPDPYYDNTFDRVYDLVGKGSVALLQHIREKHNL